MEYEHSALNAILAWFLIGAWLVAEIRMWWISRTFKDTGDFELTSQENTNLNRAQRKNATLTQNIAKTQKQIATLIHKGRNLRRNKTGEFDRRSALGKKLNKDLKRIQVMAFRHQNELTRAEAEIQVLLAIPATRARPWIRGEAYRVSGRFTLIGLAISITTAIIIGWNYEFLIICFWTTLFFCIAAFYRKHFASKLGF